jgi:hypothetical protein
MRGFMAKQITNLDEGKAFIQALHDADMMFHFEDSPSEIVKGLYGGPLFTPPEARLVAKRVAELYAMDWKPAGEECPIGYALTIMGHKGHKE